MNDIYINWDDAPEWATHYVVSKSHWGMGGFHRYDSGDENYWDSKDDKGSYWSSESERAGDITIIPRPEEQKIVNGMYWDGVSELEVGHIVSLGEGIQHQTVCYISKGSVCLEDCDGIAVSPLNEVLPVFPPTHDVLQYLVKEGMVTKDSYHYTNIKDMLGEGDK